jgi:ribosomal-protein-alanine N-acetyltransferase
MAARQDDRAAALYRDLPEILTPRTTLRRMRPSDLDDLFAYGSDPEVTRYTGWTAYRSIDDARPFLDRTLERYALGLPCDWAIEHRIDGCMIGTAGFIWWESHEFAAEIGYALARPYWNQGIITEVVHAIVRFGWHQMELNRVQAHCEVENLASQRVLEKCGFRYEGTLRERVFSKGRFIDLLLYAILRQDAPDQITEKGEPS